MPVSASFVVTKNSHYPHCCWPPLCCWPAAANPRPRLSRSIRRMCLPPFRRSTAKMLSSCSARPPGGSTARVPLRHRSSRPRHESLSDHRQRPRQRRDPRLFFDLRWRSAAKLERRTDDRDRQRSASPSAAPSWSPIPTAFAASSLPTAKPSPPMAWQDPHSARKLAGKKPAPKSTRCTA